MLDNILENRWVELLLLIIIISIFMFMGLYMLPLFLLIPAPLVVHNIKNKTYIAGISIVIPSILLGVLINPILGIIMALIFIPLIISLTIGINKNKTNMELIFIGVVTLIISFLLILLVFQLGEINISESLDDLFITAIEEVEQSIDSLNLSQKEFDEFKEVYILGYKNFILLIPYFYILISLLMVSINLSIIYFGLDRYNDNNIKKPIFSNFTLPNGSMGIGLTIAIATLILNLLKVDSADILGLNIMNIIDTLLFIQGLAIIDHFLKLRIRNGGLRFFLYLINFIFLGTMFIGRIIIYIISLIGISDFFIDYRKNRRNINSRK